MSKFSIINLNAAGQATPSNSVVKAQCDYLHQEQMIGGYWFAEQQSEHWQQLYQLIAQLLNCQTSQVSLQDSATRGLQLSLLSIPWQQGDEVVVTQQEYGANWVPLLQLQQRYDLTIHCLGNRDGAPDFSQLKQLVTERTRLVMVTWVGSHNGGVADLGAMTHQLTGFDGYVIIDACQGLGQRALDVSQVRCDFVVATGRKFLRAPRGTGFLYTSDRVLEAGLYPIVTDHVAANLMSCDRWSLRSDARRFECWEANWASRMGLKVALMELLANPEQVYQTLAQISLECRERLSRVPGVELRDTGNDLSAIITFQHQSRSAAQLHQYLRSEGIETSISQSDAGPMDFAQRQLSQLNRVSPHIYTTEQDIDQLISRLSDA